MKTRAIVGGVAALGVVGLFVALRTPESSPRRSEARVEAPVATETAPETSPAPAPAPVPEPVTKITARELYRAYADNEVVADQNYKGKMLQITGYVTSIGKDFMGRPFVVMSAGESGQIQTLVPIDVATKIHTGQSWYVHGRCKGMILGEVFCE